MKQTPKTETELKRGSSLRLVWLPAASCYRAFWNGQATGINGTMHWQSIEDARRDCAAHGLVLDKAGNVTVAETERSAQA